ncbi:MAG: glycosyltransferase, partial [Patescibacteria group bacterium]
GFEYVPSGFAATTVPDLRLINPKTFLPSTRSIAFRKKAWEKVGGFNECYSHNEDTPFALALRKEGYTFFFEPKAVVGWYQQTSLKGVWRQFFRYGIGDAQAWSLTTQYPILLGLVLASLGLIFLGIKLSPWWFIVWLAMTLIYLELPLILQPNRTKHLSFIYLIPVTRLMIIVATLIGFSYGLLFTRRVR